MGTVKHFFSIRGKLKVETTKPGFDILQSCSGQASHRVKDMEFEGVIDAWASGCGLKITHAQQVVLCIFTIAVFGNEAPAFPYFFLYTSLLIN